MKVPFCIYFYLFFSVHRQVLVFFSIVIMTELWFVLVAISLWKKGHDGFKVKGLS